MIKIFEQLKAKEMAKSINEFEIELKSKNQIIFATQIFPRSEESYDAFVHYKQNGYGNYGIKTETMKESPKEEKEGIMKSEEREEMGAAWEGKYGSLSVKYKSGSQEFVKKKELEETKTGFKAETEKGNLLFEKLSKEQRFKETMPHYKVYKVVN